MKKATSGSAPWTTTCTLTARRATMTGSTGALYRALPTGSSTREAEITPVRVSAKRRVRPPSVQASVFDRPTSSTSRVKLPSGTDAVEGAAVVAHLARRAVGMEVVVHGAEPEVAGWPAFGLVAAVVRPFGVGRAEQLEGTGDRVHEVEAVAHGEQQPALLAQHDGGGEVGHRPAPMVAGRGLPALDGAAGDVDPPQRLLHLVPERSLTDAVSGTQPPPRSACSSPRSDHASSRRAGSRSAWATSINARIRASAAARSRSRIASSTSRCASIVRS